MYMYIHSTCSHVHMCAVVKALYSKSYLYHNVDMLHVRVFMYMYSVYIYMYIHYIHTCTC